jgi:AraC-like DNA-binding protein
MKPAGKRSPLAAISGDLSCCDAFCQLFDHLPGVQFWIKDRQGKYATMNRACLLDYQFTDPGEACGKTDADLSPAHIASQFAMDDARVLAGEVIENRLELVGRFDHTAMWCVTTKVPLRDRRGRIVGTVGMTRPITSKEQISAQHTDASIARVIEGFLQRITEPMDNAEMSKIAGLSVRAFERRFKESFHVTPQHYFRRLRVRLACQPLVYAKLSVAEIASHHGFCDQSHFGREFRRETGMSPREYREHFSAKK